MLQRRKEIRNSLFICAQIHFAVILLNTSPIAIGRTSPEALGKAISRAEDNNLAIETGTDPLAIQEKAKCNCSAETVSEAITFRCSYPHPDGPHPEPLGDFLMELNICCFDKLICIAGDGMSGDGMSGMSNTRIGASQQACELYLE